VDGYFRRGLAEIKLGRMAEARADLQKVLDLAPSGPQAELARKAVEQLKSGPLAGLPGTPAILRDAAESAAGT